MEAETSSDWVDQSDIGNTDSKQNGNDAEDWVRDHYNLEEQDPEICPEAAHDAVDPRTGTPIEIKSCQIRYNGTGDRGRFQIWDYAHRELLDRGGAYIFVVHEPRTDSFHVYLHRPLSAQEVDELISSWHPIDHRLRPEDAHRTSLGQSRVFTDIQIERIEEDSDPEAQADEQDADPEPEPGEDPEADADPGIPQVERVKTTLQTIRKIEEQHSDGMAPETVVIAALQSKGISKSEAKHQIEELKKRGEIYLPRDGHYRVT